MAVDRDLSNLDNAFPADFTEEQRAQAKTQFLKNLSLEAHRFYGGKMQTVPKCGFYGFNWFNVWYTPGVSMVSTSIRDDNEVSFRLSNRGNLVAVLSDSTRVLGDGDCTPAGGLGVMEGKALLMKYLGGVDATALCIDSRDSQGNNNPDKIINFVKMIQPSFGAINLEDISQPNCYRVLDELRDSCDIPVWHDDAQGTACVSLAGLLNALKLADKTLSQARIVFLGAGASNTTIARLIMADGGNPDLISLFDSRGGLHTGRADIAAESAYYRKWELCQTTNPKRFDDIQQAVKGADVLIALSKPGPAVIKPEWIAAMNSQAIVFACANPVPEIWPYAAKQAGAFIVATGRGDFPNQINNSLCFPGILKGALLVRARKITDSMAIRSAHSIAEFTERRGISPDNIIANMAESDIFAVQAADVAQQAITDGVARLELDWPTVHDQARSDISASQALYKTMMEEGHIASPPPQLIESALAAAIAGVS